MTSWNTSAAQWPSSWRAQSPPWSILTRECLVLELISFLHSHLHNSRFYFLCLFCLSLNVWDGELKDSSKYYLEHIRPSQAKPKPGKIQQRWPNLGSWWWNGLNSHGICDTMIEWPGWHHYLWQVKQWTQSSDICDINFQFCLFNLSMEYLPKKCQLNWINNNINKSKYSQ